MPVDLQYLLSLQELRAATGDVFNEFFNGLSKLSVEILPFLPFLVFWALSRKWGYRFMLTNLFGDLLNGIIKLTVCAYRPWIRSEKIVPAGDSKVAATGYSFPSGHSLSAATLYGTAAVGTRKEKRWVSVLCVVLILLTGFSRNFLGVHTPQDVIVGIAEGLLLVLLAGPVMKWLEGKQLRADVLSVLGLLLVAGAITYVKLKLYPMDYMDGKLLVDPQEMMKDVFRAGGSFAGLMAGSFVERHYIHFSVPKKSPLLPLLAALGLGILYAWRNYFAPATVIAALGPQWGNFVFGLVMVFFAVAVWPLVIRRFCGNGEEEPSAE